MCDAPSAACSPMEPGSLFSYVSSHVILGMDGRNQMGSCGFVCFVRFVCFGEWKGFYETFCGFWPFFLLRSMAWLPHHIQHSRWADGDGNEGGGVMWSVDIVEASGRTQIITLRILLRYLWNHWICWPCRCCLWPWSGLVSVWWSTRKSVSVVNGLRCRFEGFLRREGVDVFPSVLC